MRYPCAPSTSSDPTDLRPCTSSSNLGECRSGCWPRRAALALRRPQCPSIKSYCDGRRPRVMPIQTRFRRSFSDEKLDGSAIDLVDRRLHHRHPIGEAVSLHGLPRDLQRKLEWLESADRSRRADEFGHEQREDPICPRHIGKRTPGSHCRRSIRADVVRSRRKISNGTPLGAAWCVRGRGQFHGQPPVAMRLGRFRDPLPPGAVFSARRSGSGTWYRNHW